MVPQKFLPASHCHPQLVFNFHLVFSRGADAMMKEIFNRGPISCGVDANPLLNYESGAVALKLIRSSSRLHG